MATLNSICKFLDLTLDLGSCEDPSNNGLQVQGASEVKHAVFGVDACLALFKQAAAAEADFVFVHHGLSWKGGLKYLTGINAKRLALLFQNSISLYAAHLPLDRHHIHGHNKCIADFLALDNLQPYFAYNGVTIGWRGELAKTKSLADLKNIIDLRLAAGAMLLDVRNAPVKHIGVVSGGAADAIEESANLGIDCLITGEMDHAHYHTAFECGVDVIAAGHYKTEVPGVKAIMKLLDSQFDLDCRFIDIPTGF